MKQSYAFNSYIAIKFKLSPVYYKVLQNKIRFTTILNEHKHFMYLSNSINSMDIKITLKKSMTSDVGIKEFAF